MRQRGYSRPNGHPEASGFTLVELTAVIMLVALLTVLAVPTVNAIAVTRTAAAQHLIQRDLSFARERAVATGRTTWVVFNLSTNTYRVLEEPDGAPGRANAAAIIDAASGREFVTRVDEVFPSVSIVSVAFDQGTEVGFDWRGVPLSSEGAGLSAPGVVTISGGRTITVHPGSGLPTSP